jgi:hypothetical protein
MTYKIQDFTDALFGKNQKFTVRVIQENGNGHKNHVFFESMPFYDGIIKQYNNDCGVFMMPNHSGAAATKNTDIKYCNAVFIDIDDGPLPGFFPIEPSAIISRDDNQGHHVYWFINRSEDFKSWENVQKVLIKYYKSDAAIKNLSRIMRLPGTINNKPKRNQQKYNIVQLNKKRYDLDDVLNAHFDKTGILERIKKRAIEKINASEFNKTDRGTVNDLFVAIVMKMQGHLFPESDMESLLNYLNEKHLDSIFDDQDIKKRITARKYAKNKTGEELKDEIQKELARQERMKNAVNDWVYIQKNAFFVHKEYTGIERTVQEFNNMFAYEAGIMNVSNYVLVNNLIQQAENITYKPGRERFIKSQLKDYPLFNIYENDAVTPDPGQPYEWFINHVEYLIKDEKEREHFFDWLAYAYQNIDKRINHAILIIGNQGIGKGVLNNVFEQLFGVSNISRPKNSNLADKYTKWAKHTKLCIINELKQGDKYAFYDMVKDYITDPVIEIREMHKDGYEIENYMNFIAYSNHDNPIKLEKDDRRFYVIKSYAQPKEPEYYRDFIKNSDENTGGVATWLLDRDISHFNPGERPETTAAKKDILNDSRAEIDVWLEEGINRIFSAV